MGGRTSGSGNAAWRATMAQWQGWAGRPQCQAIANSTGQRCKRITIKNWHRCWMHGGAMVLSRRGLYRRKLRHAAWTKGASQDGS